MSGLELMQALVEQRLRSPPMAETMGFALTAVSEGEAEFQCKITRRHLNPFGTVHGGVALALLDSAAGCALHTLLLPGVGYASIETKVNYTAPLTLESGTVRAVGRILSKGKTIATAEAKLYGEDDQLVAHGSSTLMILPKIKWADC
jgi:uncharacterized protein (TIGR00369 family)